MSADSRVPRRALLPATAALAGAGLSAKVPGRVGLALYTLRHQLEKEPRETLRTAAAIGYRDVEIMRSQIQPLAPYLKEFHLRPVSVHFETPLITANREAWLDAEMPPLDAGVTYEATLALAKEHGLRYVVFNYLPPQERGELDFYRWLADRLNRAAEQCRAAGMQFCYHNHNFEFQPKTGGRPIDVLLERLDPQLIRLEVDVFWVSMAGQNATEFVRQHAARIELLHVKDRRPGVAPRFDIASVPDDTFREAGHGDLDLPGILAAAGKNVRYCFVEQDHSPDPLRSIRESYEYLHQLNG